MSEKYAVLKLTAFCAIALSSYPALAGPGDPCSTLNKIYEVEGPSGPGTICDGTRLQTLESVRGNPVAKGIRTDDPETTLDVNGEVRFGYTGIGCDANREGAIRYDSTVNELQLCDGSEWNQITADCDIVPNSFDFTDVSGVTVSTTQASNIVQITGISCQIDITVSGDGTPEFRTCSDASCTTEISTWGSSAGVISENEYLQIRATARANSFEFNTASINVGGTTDTYTVTSADAGTYKRAFALQNVYANMGGIAGGDALCQAEAEAYNLAGTYYAWLATDASDDPESRFTQATIDYRNVDGITIANNWTDLTDGTLDNDIDDITGGGFSDSVWTNVNTDGTVNSTTDHCESWTINSTALSTPDGNTGATNSTWTDDGTDTCNNPNTIWCFEQ